MEKIVRDRMLIQIGHYRKDIRGSHSVQKNNQFELMNVDFSKFLCQNSQNCTFLSFWHMILWNSRYFKVEFLFYPISSLTTFDAFHALIHTFGWLTNLSELIHIWWALITKIAMLGLLIKPFIKSSVI